MEINDEQEQIPADELIGDEILFYIEWRKSLEHS
jgi:hypothetical protein